MARTPKGPRVKVEITEDIIECALTRDSQHCMIADAVKVAYPDAFRVSVDLATIRFTDQKKHLRYTYLTPRIAQVELVKFDQGMKTEPFDFTLKGAHVTRSGSSHAKRVLSTAQKAAAAKNAKKGRGQSPLSKQRVVARGDTRGVVPDRVGGRTPPLQRDSTTKVPFSRRRAFGLRGLSL